MNNVKKIALVILALSFALVCVSGCKKDKDGNDNGEVEEKFATYSVTVVDEIGKPVSNVMLKYSVANGEIKTAVSDKNGSATLKNALVGGSVKPEQGFSDAVILTAEYKLEDGKTDIRVIVRDSVKANQIYGAVAEDTYAYPIGIGNHSIPTVADKMSYLIFNAPTEGVYRFSVGSASSDAEVGYYGNPMIVQENHLAEGEYDGKSFELTIRDLNAPYVIGLMCAHDSDAALVIERVGDAPFDPSYDVPVVNVTAKNEVEQFTLPAGTTLKDFDVTDKNITVSLGDDGFYYTSEGKKLYLRIDSVGDYSNYISVPFASIATMAGLEGYQMGGTGGGNFGGYTYDENGDYVDKRIYNDMLESYWEKCDPTTGVYPLTEELAEAVKVHGDNAGWWDKDSEGTYIFKVLVNADNAWLFLCMVEN